MAPIWCACQSPFGMMGKIYTRNTGGGAARIQCHIRRRRSDPVDDRCCYLFSYHGIWKMKRIERLERLSMTQYPRLNVRASTSYPGVPPSC
ncbi:hypothetical protein FOTG_14892 [Fusarium oxysporum f. sp. vasinfectum 25433]|uniref:Uncharacterized protein n=1 Tax=Fusarium oxysporum f. sp. vasinfectum 25433 TaxID=1089449 RepID=X0L734_FUSOX|nr:hypothetical protein FOTG_14892 [Fusarium oxysporum f. sp. vasinfectum 25433]